MKRLAIAAAVLLVGCGSDKQAQPDLSASDLRDVTGSDLSGDFAPSPDALTMDLAMPDLVVVPDLFGAPLPAPTLTVVDSDFSVALSWNSITGATSYDVMTASTPGGPYTLLKQTSATTYDFDAAPCVTVYYVVQAHGAPAPDSAYSNEVASKPGGALHCMTVVRSVPQYNAVAANGDIVIAVGNDGVIARSDDGGVSFTKLPDDPLRTVNLYGVVYGTDRFVANGQNEFWYSDADGSTWTKSPTTNKPTFGAIAFGDSKFVVLTTNRAYVSADGVDWDSRTLPNTSSGGYGIAYGAGRWVGAGLNGAIVTSTNATMWSAVTTSGLPSGIGIGGLVYSGSQFVLFAQNGGSVFSSSDGAAWTKRRDSVSGQEMAGIATDGTQFLLVGTHGTVAAASDLTTWSAASTLYADIPLRAAAYNGTRYIVVGKAGTILTTTDGSAMTEVSLDADLTGIATSPTALVAVGSAGEILRSIDNGDTWSAQWKDRKQGFSQVAYGADVFAAITDTGGIWVSADDGITWDEKTSPLSHAEYTTGQTVRFVKDVFIASEGQKIVTSSDGGTWTQRHDAGGTNWVDAFYSSLYYAVGSDGSILSSTDAITWTTSAFVISGANSISSATFRPATDGALLYVAGDLFASFSSTDLDTWNSQIYGGSLQAVTYGNGAFYGVDGSAIADSTDGITWRTGTPRPYSAVALTRVLPVASDIFVVGENGTIFRQ